MKSNLLLSLALVAASGIAHASAANLVFNGSFEQGPGGLGSFAGWQVVLGDSATFVDSSGQTGMAFGQASDGLWSAYFGSTVASGGSTITQTIPTIAGQAYALTYDLANDNAGLPANNFFTVKLAGTDYALSLTNVPSMNYMRSGVSFVATQASTLLTFSAANNAGYVQLDNVVVTPVPEPGSLAVLLVGSAIGIVQLRRRRQRTL